MARPVWFSFDSPTHTIVGGRIVANAGNWGQGQGGEPLQQPRYIWQWFVDGVRVSGDEPPTRSKPDEHFAGEGDNGFDLARLTPGSHTVRFRVFAGNYFTGWGDVPEDWIEWGDAHVTSGAPYVVDLAVQIPSPPATDPRPWIPLRDAARSLLEQAVIELRNAGVSEANVYRQRVTIAQQVLAADDAQRKAVYDALRDVFRWPS